MNDLEREKKEMPCPKCKRPIRTTLYDKCSRREIKCSSCGSMYQFDSSAASNLKHSISNLESAQEKFSDSFQKMMSTATIVLKS